MISHHFLHTLSENQEAFVFLNFGTTVEFLLLNMMEVCIFTFLVLILYVHCTTPVNEIRASYDPVDLLSHIFNTTAVPLGRANSGLVQFEDTLHPIRFKEFEDNLPNNNYYKSPVKYIDDNINQNSEVKFQDNKKKRSKKRKPRQHNYPPQYLGVRPLPNYGQGPINPYLGQNYNFRPEPSLASTAISRVTEALTSIALYDDRQCVARLLCEAAGGGNLGTSGILQAVSGLQPLLTLLSAYNGASSNPLYVFGRAVFLGMSSKQNTASCRYGYPLCPTDTEQLVHYLNNHNGGFFRFFNDPQQGQQHVEQFYNQLSQNTFHQGQNSIQQNYGIYNPNPGNQHYGFQQPNPYTTYNQNYGDGYVYGSNVNNIQKRIQNMPLSQYIDDFQDVDPKWTFPYENNYNNNDNTKYNSANEYDGNLYGSSNKRGKEIKFPEQNNAIIDNYGKTLFKFPESQNYQPLRNGYVKPNNNSPYNNNFDYILNNNYIDNNLQTVYVLRGNGDPNKPEIHKLRPGESVH